MKVLFIGGVFPKEKEEDYFNSSIAQFQAAANAWQWNVIEGLEKNLGTSVDILNAVFIAPFPNGYKRVWESSYEWHHSSESKNVNISFLNIFPIKNMFREINLKRALKKWIKQNQKHNPVIIAYSPHVPFLKSLKVAKKHGLKTCLILPDLLKFTGTARQKSKIYNCLKRVEVRRFYENLRYVDKFVLFTEAMASDINVRDNYVVIEGIADIALANDHIEEEQEYKTILYSGTLHSKYGIQNVVDSFSFIDDPKYRLFICGDGDSKEYIKEKGKTDPRIVYLGTKKREDVIELQRKATVLINPRPNVGDYTRYSFPSKTIEYMLSGKPVMCFKLDGIPDEYDNYLVYLNSLEPRNLASEIVGICELDAEKRHRMGEQARDFVTDQKNNLIQTRKILDLLKMR